MRTTLGLLTVLALFGLVGTVGAGEGKRERRDPAQIVAKIDERIAHVGERISRIEGKLAEHPDAPEAVKSAANKLVTDLGSRKAELGELKSAVQAGNKEEAKASIQTIKSQREMLQADRAALRDAIQAARAERGERGGPRGERKQRNVKA